MNAQKLALQITGRLAELLEEEIHEAMVTATRAAAGRVMLEVATGRLELEAPAAEERPQIVVIQFPVAIEAGELGELELATAGEEDEATAAETLEDFVPEPEPAGDVEEPVATADPEHEVEEETDIESNGLSEWLRRHENGDGHCDDCPAYDVLYLCGDWGTLCYQCAVRARTEQLAAVGLPIDTPADVVVETSSPELIEQRLAQGYVVWGWNDPRPKAIEGGEE